ncbi:glycosyltransferase family 2 protein [Cobetia sp. Dlab-2-AX]|uniref:glycosyltransferase family 2 protein n=1 Tax=unclassified Cobetia TaxID=2609414 RepID=UPI002096F283|nr:glycosyltransferase family 2 protein [Cobetia sp. Dlab-2-AX]MCO7236736.1 glycosyltransferase family 2 protein [Cobetia sp. Dlab-2-U]
MKLAVAAIVKNEVDCLPEWLAYHRLVGVSQFLIADNSSNDGTRELLAASNDVILKDVVTKHGEPPQLAAYEYLLKSCPAEIDVLAFIDADEFILPVQSDDERQEKPPSILPWLESCFFDESVGAVALNWACFGSSGEIFREPGLVIERFTSRSYINFGPNHHYKSIVRPTDVLGFDNPHHVRLKHGRYVNALGDPLKSRIAQDGTRRVGLSEDIIWQGARINHYIVKSVEEFLSGKSKRGSAAQKNYNKGRDYFERHDRNDETCTIAAQIAPHLKMSNDSVEKASVKKLDSSNSSKTDVVNLMRDFGRRIVQKMGFGDDPTPYRWTLDYPSSEHGSLFLPGGRVVQGWVLLHPDIAATAPKVRIIARWEDQFEVCHPLEIKRPDVINKILHDVDDSHPQRQCGFRFTIPTRVTRFYLELLIDDYRWPLQIVKCEADQCDTDALKVIEGSEGWLFLDNDTNGSVDQYRGRMHLTKYGIERWRGYFKGVAKIANDYGCRWSMLIAPAKETIMGPRYHTAVQDDKRPISQLLALSEATHVVHPEAALLALGDDAYIRTDTHWTQRGAMKATIELAVELGLPRDKVENLFSKDRYTSKSMGGDLGNKLTPRRVCHVDMLKSFSYMKHRLYDNGLPNFGRMLVINYPEALFAGTCLIFGSSSTNSMFHYISRVFKRVVFVHTAGSIDQDVVDSISPDYLITQSNARFLLQVPEVEYSLTDMIDKKISRLDSTEIEKISDKMLVSEEASLNDIGVLKWHQQLIRSITSS